MISYTATLAESMCGYTFSEDGGVHFSDQVPNMWNTRMVSSNSGNERYTAESAMDNDKESPHSGIREKCRLYINRNAVYNEKM